MTRRSLSKRGEEGEKNKNVPKVVPNSVPLGEGGEGCVKGGKGGRDVHVQQVRSDGAQGLISGENKGSKKRQHSGKFINKLDMANTTNYKLRRKLETDTAPDHHLDKLVGVSLTED